MICSDFTNLEWTLRHFLFFLHFFGFCIPLVQCSPRPCQPPKSGLDLHPKITATYFQPGAYIYQEQLNPISWWSLTRCLWNKLQSEFKNPNILPLRLYHGCNVCLCLPISFIDSSCSHQVGICSILKRPAHPACVRTDDGAVAWSVDYWKEVAPHLTQQFCR